MGPVGGTPSSRPPRTRAEHSACSGSAGRKRARHQVDDEGEEDSSPRLISCCSPKMVKTMFTGITKECVDIITSLGFGGLLRLPYIPAIDRQFSLWLLSRVDCVTMRLHLGDGSSVALDRQSVVDVLGISGGPMEIAYSHRRQSARFKDVVKRLLDEEGGITVSVVKNILEKRYPEEMCEKDRDAFKVAVVCFCCAYFLGAKGSTATVPPEIIASVSDPDSISDYNWPGYVLRVIRDSAEKIQADSRIGTSTLSFSGCLLYLQVRTCLSFIVHVTLLFGLLFVLYL